MIQGGEVRQERWSGQRYVAMRKERGPQAMWSGDEGGR